MKTTLIIGAGPAGAALGYTLASRGLKVTLLERQRDFAREFRGEGFQPSGIDVLRQLGLGERFDALPQRRMERLEIWRGARRLASLPVQPGSGAAGTRVVSQPALLEMVVEEAGRFGGFTLERGVAVRDVLKEDGRVVGVRVEREGREEEIRADYVVGTDGRFSVLRRKAGLPESRTPQAFDVLWCKVPLPAFWPGEGHVETYLTDGGLCLALPSYDGRLQLGWVVGKGRYRELKGQGMDAWLEALAGRLRPELGAHLRASRAEVSAPFLLDVICDRLERWTAPGLLLLGDAAHPMSPVGGQGVNVALRDALVAANHLVPVLKAGGSPQQLDEAAARVQAERQAEVEAIQAIQTRQGAVLLGEGLKTRLWFSVLPLVMKLPGLPGLMTRAEGRFQRVLGPVRLTV